MLEQTVMSLVELIGAFQPEAEDSDAIGQAQAELMADGSLAKLANDWLGKGARLPG